MWTNDDEGDEIKDALQLQTNIHEGHKTQHNTTTITIKLLTDAKDTRWWSLPDQLVVRGGGDYNKYKRVETRDTGSGSWGEGK